MFMSWPGHDAGTTQHTAVGAAQVTSAMGASMPHLPPTRGEPSECFVHASSSACVQVTVAADAGEQPPSPPMESCGVLTPSA